MSDTGTTAGEVTMIERLVSVETKLDLLREELGPRLQDHETRLRAVEGTLTDVKVRVGLIAGGTGTGAGLVAGLVTYLSTR